MYGVPTFFKRGPRHRARCPNSFWNVFGRGESFGALGLIFPYTMVYGVPTFFKPWLTFQSFLREMVYNGLNSGTPELVHLIPRCTKIGVPIGTPVCRIIIPDMCLCMGPRKLRFPYSGRSMDLDPRNPRAVYKSTQAHTTAYSSIQQYTTVYNRIQQYTIAQYTIVYNSIQ